MPKELAIRLLRAHRDDIAKAILARVDRLAPSMAQIDRRARTSSVGAIADLVAGALDGGDMREVASILRNTIRLRLAGGVTKADMIATTHTYLPAIRRVFLEVHDDRAAALAAFERLEDAALPMVVDIARVIVEFDPTDLDDEPTNPSMKKKPRPLSSPFQSGEGE